MVFDQNSKKNLPHFRNGIQYEASITPLSKVNPELESTLSAKDLVNDQTLACPLPLEDVRI